MTEPETPTEKTPGRPESIKKRHASEEREARAWPRSNREIANETFRCGYWGHRRSDGELCRAVVVEGTKSCYRHAGVTLKEHKARGAIVTELAKWGLDGRTSLPDPGEILLRLVAQSADRVRLYSALLAEAFAATEAGNALDPVMRQHGVGALIGYRYGVDRDGNTFPVEEAIRGLTQLEAMERDRLTSQSAKAIAAGLAERQVRMAETQGVLLVSAIRAMMDELDLSPEQQARVGEVVARNLRAITGSLT